LGRNDHQNNLEKYKAEFGEDIPLQRTSYPSEEGIFLFKTIASGQENRSTLACFHLSTAKEMDLFTNKIPLEDKNYCRSLYSPSLVYQ
jgi:dihydroorotase